VVLVFIGAVLVQGTHEEGDVIGWVRVGGQEARSGDGEGEERVHCEAIK
jgi:hypothetical protein